MNYHVRFEEAQRKYVEKKVKELRKKYPSISDWEVESLARDFREEYRKKYRWEPPAIEKKGGGGHEQ